MLFDLFEALRIFGFTVTVDFTRRKVSFFLIRWGFYQSKMNILKSEEKVFKKDVLFFHIFICQKNFSLKNRTQALRLPSYFSFQ